MSGRALAIVLSSAAPAATAPDFATAVAPILEAKCLSCHNADEAKGSLVLASRNEAMAHESAVVPGDPDRSLLLEQVAGPDPAMPKRGKHLTAGEVATLRRWIESGAPWPEDRLLVDKAERDLDWWSLKPLERPRVPDGGADNPVDSFVNAGMTEKGLVPAPEADALTLVRRMTYDLTGLPPTPGEVAAFVQAHRKDAVAAVARLADRLLASPAFGEKWGQHWLDLARYAETHGYDKDKPRNNAWPYRDYVIRSFNEDKPYSRFVQEQVAGDVLFPGDPDGVLGLGFLAAGPWDFIGHQEVGEAKVDGRIAKHLDRDEMVSAVFNVFQSTTVQCAQCHHHKSDPVRMEDYYRLHAVFAAADRADRVYEGLSPAQQSEKSRLLQRVNALRTEQELLDTQAKQRLAARASGIDRRLAELKEKHGSPLEPQYGYHSRISNRQDMLKWVQVDLGSRRPVEQLHLMPAFDKFNNIGAGFGFPPRFKVEAFNHPGFDGGGRLLLDATAEDWPNQGSDPVTIDVGGEPVRFLRVTATKLAPRRNDYIFAIGELEATGGQPQENFARGAVVTAMDSIEAPVRWGRANLVDGIYHRVLDNPEALAEMRQLEKKRAAIEREVRPPGTAKRLEGIRSEVAGLNAKLKDFPAGRRIYAAATEFQRQGRFTATGGNARPVHLLHRGDIRSPGEVMSPGWPPLWPGAPSGFASGNPRKEGDARAALARYLTHRDNPLLWRSIANRLWQWTFGKPLAGTPNDFGRMGMTPTHPELLDWLAASLRDDPDQSLKSVVKLLFTSETYRRSGAHHAGNATIDADNDYLWRAHRRRLTAEEFRDSVLAVSGALRAGERGGPSFRDFVIEKPQHSPHYQYHLHDPDDPAAHRRSIYRFVVRSQPQPLLTTLDCADPSLSVPQRDESTTALQALVQWNNRFVEAGAVRFGARIGRDGGASSVEQVTFACRVALGREPDPSERAALEAHLRDHGAASMARVIFNLNAFAYVD